MGRAQGSTEAVTLNRRRQTPVSAPLSEEQLEQLATDYLTSTMFLDELIADLEQLLPEEIHREIGVAFAGRCPDDPTRLGQMNVQSRNLLIYEGNLSAEDGVYAHLPAAAASLVMRGVLRHEGLHARESGFDELAARVEEAVGQEVAKHAPEDAEFFWRLLNKLEDGRIEHIDATLDPEGHRAIALQCAIMAATPAESYIVKSPDGITIPWEEQYIPVDAAGQQLHIIVEDDGSRWVHAEQGRELTDDIWGEQPLTANLHAQALSAIHQSVRPSGRLGTVNERVATALSESQGAIGQALTGNEQDVLAAAWTTYNICRRHRLTVETLTGDNEPLSLAQPLIDWLNATMAKPEQRRPMAEKCPATSDELVAAFQAEDRRLQARVLAQPVTL